MDRNAYLDFFLVIQLTKNQKAPNVSLSFCGKFGGCNVSIKTIKVCAPGFIGPANLEVVTYEDHCKAMKEAYMAGWNASGEGWNAEYPGGVEEKSSWIREYEYFLEEQGIAK